MAKWLNGQVVENKRWTERLHSLRVKADIAPFEAGQFTRLALDVDGDEVSRPFSLVNAPDELVLDFYFIEVPDGVLSTRLSALQPGDDVWVAPKAAGLMTLKQLAPASKLFLIATGTGLGPFLSIIKTTEVWQQFEQVCLVHAVRFAEELSYQDTINDVKAAHAEQFHYQPIVSREASPNTLSGRIPQLIDNQQLEQALSIEIDKDCQVLLCGNPAMVQETTEVLLARGLTRHSRREAGNISIEKYW
ncbi:MAG: ferredoxin--NADP reductase [Methylophaga sp.]